MKLITISREFGSGGRELGKRLADKMGFSYYDKEIIGKIAENLKLNEQYIESVLDRGFTVNYPYTFRRSFSTQMNALNQATTILVEQQKIILHLQKKEIVSSLAGVRRPSFMTCALSLSLSMQIWRRRSCAAVRELMMTKTCPTASWSGVSNRLIKRALPITA